MQLIRHEKDREKSKLQTDQFGKSEWNYHWRVIEQDFEWPIAKNWRIDEDANELKNNNVYGPDEETER